MIAYSSDVSSPSLGPICKGLVPAQAQNADTQDRLKGPKNDARLQHAQRLWCIKKTKYLNMCQIDICFGKSLEVKFLRT